MVGRPTPGAEREYGLIVRQPEPSQQILAKSVMMILNYRYGSLI